MNILAYYLPQFHRVKENDEWWGEGFTEWTNVKRSVSLYEGHNQPRIPLYNNYYDLLDINTMKWQGELATKYGISFCVYHYWFNGKLLLEKPMENLLKHKEVKFPFCFSWANENWTNGWTGKDGRILMQNDFTDRKDWEAHFYYLLPFFKDSRYIKEKDCPIFVLYRPQLLNELKEFIDCWNNLAKKNGFKKIVFIFQSASMIKEKPEYMEFFDYGVEFQPGYNESIVSGSSGNKSYAIDSLRTKVSNILQNKLHIYISLTNILDKFSNKKIDKLYDFEEMQNRILNNKPLNNKMIPGAMKDWDNTPRYGSRGKVYEGSTPKKFCSFLEKQIKRAKEVYHKNAIFVFAWNEWGEGGYLEPDTVFGYQYLEGIKTVLENLGEFEIPQEEQNSNIIIELSEK